MGFHRIVGGGTDPGFSVLRFDSQNKTKAAKTTQLSSGIGAAI